MRWLISIVCAGLSVMLLAGLLTLYYWVPRFKAEVLGLGTELPGWQVALITLSDIVVRYFYIAFPAVLAICYGMCRLAFASENESSRTKS